MLQPNPLRMGKKRVAEELATLRNAALQGIEERAAHYAVTNLRREIDEFHLHLRAKVTSSLGTVTM